MAERETAGEEFFVRFLQGRVSRGRLLKAIGAGVAMAAVPRAAAAAGSQGMSFPYFPNTSGSYTTEQVQDILNATATIEALSITAVTAALTTEASALQLNAQAKDLLQAILAHDVYHYDFLTSLGGKPLTSEFTFPPTVFGQGALGFLIGGEAIETLETAGYMTATREFAELGQPTLAKNAYQVGAIESQHVAVIRAALSAAGVPGYENPVNHAFATDLLLYVRDELAVLHTIGLVGGSGTVMAFPGRDAALAASGPVAATIIQKKPNNASTTFTLGEIPESITGERT
jgi:hypothetical protein